MADRLVKVPLYGQRTGYAKVNADATNGATVGVNLYWPDGSVVTEADLTTASTSTTSAIAGVPDGVSVTLWSLILNVPLNVKALANTSTNGLYAVTDATTGTSATRTLQDSSTIAWTNPDGVAGDPSAAFIGTTDDVPEGVANLYFTDARAQAASLNSVFFADILQTETGAALISEAGDIMTVD